LLSSENDVPGVVRAACQQIEPREAIVAGGDLPNPESQNSLTSIINRALAEHYMWGSECDGWHLVKTGELSVIEERMPASATEVRHYHKRSRQFFYVLSGELTMEVEHHEFVLRAGDGLEVKPGQNHQAMNRGPQDTRCW
jgi:mannose-6-phosphate isomerase-like protein (cupin superfamily)